MPANSSTTWSGSRVMGQSHCRRNINASCPAWSFLAIAMLARDAFVCEFVALVLGCHSTLASASRGRAPRGTRYLSNTLIHQTVCSFTADVYLRRSCGSSIGGVLPQEGSVRVRGERGGSTVSLLGGGIKWTPPTCASGS